MQATLRRRILRAFVGRGLLESFESKEMLAYKHSGFSVDAGGCIEAHDRAALERLLRYCARPPFAMDRLRKEGAELVYRCAKQNSEPASDKRGANADELTLTPLELIDRIAALVPPPRTHRHRYFGVLAPNSPLRHAVTAMAAAAHQKSAARAEPPATGDGTHGPAPMGPMGNPIAPTSEHAPPKHAAHYLWAVLIARIYEVFPLLCPLCGGQMRITAFITHSADIRQILEHIGTDSEPPRVAPARGPPLWDDCDAQGVKAAKLSPTGQLSGMGRHNRHRTTKWTSASIGDSVKRRFRQLQGAAACAPDPNPSFIPRSRQCAAASAQTAWVKRILKSQTRAMLGLMRLNFLSVK